MAEIEIQTPLEKIVVNSLLLLGFNTFDLPRDLKFQVEIDTFKKSNSKALEAVLYFLFNKISPNSLGNFVFSWPPRSPDMKREFKEESFKLISKYEQEGLVPENTLLGKSVLDSAQGERVWTLLKVLTDAAMKLEITGVNIPFYPNLLPWQQNPSSALRGSVVRMKKSLMLHTKSFAHTFNQKAQILASKQASWTSHSKFLTQEHKALRAKYDELLTKKNKTDSNTIMMEKLAALDRVPQIDMLKYIWKNIKYLHESSFERKGQNHVHQLIDNVNTLRPISGDIEGNIEKWGKELEKLAEKLEKDTRTTGIQNFAIQLKEVVDMYKVHQIQQLLAIKLNKEALQAEIEQLKEKVSSYNSCSFQVNN